MNTKISATKSPKSNDNRLILSDYNDFAWAKGFLTKTEIDFVKNAAKNNILSLFLPRTSANVFIQLLKNKGNTSCEKEEVRIAGNEMLSTLAHYKIKSVTLSSYLKVNRTKEFVEGMALGNYQFLKYFKTKKDKANSLKEIKIENNSISRQELKDLQAILDATCIARDLVNEPQSYLSATQLGKEVISLGKKHGFSVCLLYTSPSPRD